MNKQLRELQFFFYSQNFSDGIRVTVGVLLPALLLSMLGELQMGVTLSLGAVCASLADSPGPVLHKRNGMLASVALCSAVALVTGFARMNPWVLGLEILVFSFLFSMLLVYGMRASFIGLGALLIMILTLDRELEPWQILRASGLVMAGGVWYMLLSLLVYQILPYRAAQQALGECMKEVAVFLRLKASFYRAHTDFNTGYRKLIAQQVLVSEKQDALRELLFKTRVVVKESTNTGRKLVMTFVDLVDLYEQITAIHYDYAALREKFGGTGVLEEIANLIELLAEGLDNISFAIQANHRHKNLVEILVPLEKLKQHLDELEGVKGEASILPLKKVYHNIRLIAQRLKDIRSYFGSNATEELQRKTEKLEFSLFVSRQIIDPRLFLSNLTFSSSVFRFSVRVALVTFFAYVLTKLFPYGHHSYWVLLTVIVILKPAFSLTKQRNYERIVGTVIGGAIGLLVLYLVPNETAQFLFMLVFMTGFYSLQRTNYALSVVLLTPFVLIVFSFLGGGGLSIVQERVIDTLVGSAIAFAATYFVFPTWESGQVDKFLLGVLRANEKYLQVLAQVLAGDEVKEVQYKLARKEVYVSAANLSAAFQRMTAEPRKKQLNSQEVYHFVVLNHILTSFIATIISTQLRQEVRKYSPRFQTLIKQALKALAEATDVIGASAINQLTHNKNETAKVESADTSLNAESQLLEEQLAFIQKVSTDIFKTCVAIGDKRPK
ncbi:FUSC family membrane protein [Rufibacter roseus]|uniref:FUSC family membrane protein n=1 Tax=Rufibacter roseus TaxID=1567108 RepID=A0ABW2DRD9_9BACT|nr:FUSC family membrane protein [Rufibacter roseus]